MSDHPSHNNSIHNLSNDQPGTSHRLDSPSNLDRSQISNSHTTPLELRSRGPLNNQVRQRIINISQQQSQNITMLSPSVSQNNLGTIHETSSDMQNTAVIWGTNINPREVEEKFINFLKNFQSSDPDVIDENQGANLYLNKLNRLHQLEQFYLDIDADHLFQFDRQLYQQLVNYPSDVILYFDRAATTLYKEIFLSSDMQFETVKFAPIQVRPYHLRKVTRMRDLNPNDINHLISIKGIVIRCSEILPELKEGHFRCVQCGHIEMSINEGGRIQEPQDCVKCRTKLSFEIVHNLCLFSDRQYIKLQETPETVPDGETPQTVTLVVYEDLVDGVRPGDRVEVTGVYRAQPMRVSANQRILRSVFNTYLDVVSFNMNNKQRFMSSEDDLDQNEFFSEEIKKQIFELASQPNIYEILVNSLAPSIWENEDVKKGVLCQLFGGCKKEFSQAGRGRFRAEINILLVGDPSTAKSQMLQYVNKIAPRGIYTSGKGSSAVGLTASISKDPETRELVLESGALVLSDQGICCIDEFDKMNDTTRVILHEAMEQQTISIAKAGIVCQLNARTAILASANPVESRYNPKRSVIENIKLPPSLLSRFDLIYIMLDRTNEANDQKLATHILSLYTKESEIEVEVDNRPKISRELLAKYISFARKKANPAISSECVDYLVESYVDMRRLGSSRNIITATPRQLESLIRISEALAKMRLSDYVEKPDVEEAVRLIKVATQQAATDPITGFIDMDLISTGITSGSRNKISQLIEYIRDILKSNEDQSRKGYKFVAMYEEAKKKFDVAGVGTHDPFTETEYREALKALEEDQVISLLGNKKIPTIKYLGLGQK